MVYNEIEAGYEAIRAACVGVTLVGAALGLAGLYIRFFEYINKPQKEGGLENSIQNINESSDRK